MLPISRRTILAGIVASATPAKPLIDTIYREPETAFGERTIPCQTGIPLVDAACDGNHAAQYLRPQDWQNRAIWFNGIIGGSFQAIMTVLEHTDLEDKTASHDWLAVSTISVHGAVAHILDDLDDGPPRCLHSAAVYALSYDPNHMEAARHYANEQGNGDPFSPFLAVAEDCPALGQFNRISLSLRPGLTNVWLEDHGHGLRGAPA